MTQTQHTPGAIRAAQRYLFGRMIPEEYQTGPGVQKLAEIIDRETGLPELVEALREILHDLDSGYIAQPSHRAEVCRRRHEARIRAAIAKATKTD